MAGGTTSKYIMSVAAALSGMHPQTLRKYEREGLIEPSRVDGYHRLYSDDDLDRLSSIRHLVHTKGVNVAGVRLLLDVLQAMTDIEDALDRTNVRQHSIQQHVRRVRSLIDSRTEEAQ